MAQTEELERVRYRFLGRVQHRGFRFACMMAAQRAGATGWVRNERNGTVTAEVQGPKEAQLAFLNRLGDIVRGLGDDWSVGTETQVECVEGERDFAIRRY